MIDRMRQKIRLRIHPLLWLVACSAVWTGYFIEFFTLFVLVLIHEMGHVAAARSYGWRIRAVELLPFGGVAQTEEWGTVPAKEEVVVALAGPFQHVAMILISLLFYGTGWWTREWTEYFIHGNVMIACFNLLPIYPLDGGRVMQAGLSFLFPFRICIDLTLWVSSFLSLVLAAAALFWFKQGILIHLFLIALFLLYSNLRALKQRHYQFLRFLLSRTRSRISSKPVKKMTVHGKAELKVVVQMLYKERYHILEVTDRTGKVIGFLPEETLLSRFLHPRFYTCTVEELF
ncbi:M50 family metallopeptidase [Thermoactinomyces daqus]|uniref:M50 family metallopeptidase n=1 Tax=Thermoactinomyces daqus TaxID=1329516 RepID=A0A7W1X7B9_9BACL|nr:M50 family metallopeptidase [Thermoactinomyces daqus]MBA4541384.1 M50 family metallopeptidase [Thermoactinomyces daqus]